MASLLLTSPSVEYLAAYSAMTAEQKIYDNAIELYRQFKLSDIEFCDAQKRFKAAEKIFDEYYFKEQDRQTNQQNQNTTI